ncbi:MAG TPA: SdrD B-like domain-containing protein [Pirellulales bacterium]|nr:SdrD B-like domain-containing protein [Pirellulales bacterium]
MGLFSRVFSWRRGRREKHRSIPSSTQHVGGRICRFEPIEPRQLLNGTPVLQLGAVYYDAHSGLGTIPNTFTVTWSGGAPGTELKQLTISTDPNGNPVAQPGDPFFHTSPDPPGVYGSNPLVIASHDGFSVTGQDPVTGSTSLVLSLNGFTAGKQLVFTIGLDDLRTNGADATVNGKEFEGSKLIGVFSAPHYQDFTATSTFYDVFNPAEQASGLPLPADNYIGGLIGGTTVNTIDQSVYTAGAFTSGRQTPLPITLAGDVYYDPDLSNARAPGDPGLGGVKLSLLVNDNGSFVPTGQTTSTDANGHYKFSGVLPGEYQVVETQPSGYFAVGSSPGSFGGATYGVSANPNLLSQIDVFGGESVVNLDFSQSLPNSIKGTVRVPPSGDCTTDPTAPPLAGVTVQLLDGQGNLLQTATTAADGTYRFTGLRAGHYTVHELLPTGYYAVDADLGNVNGTPDGTASNLQTTANIVLTSAQNGVQYDFCLQQPVSISGTVRVPPSGNCATDPTAPPLAGVTVQLLDGQGNLLQSTTTAADGTYHFTDLRAGQYTVHELLPTGYYAVDADLGNVNGTPDGSASNLQTTSNIALTSGQNGVQYDFCLQQPVSISGTVRVPPSGDCATDPTAPPLAGVTVQLLDGQGNLLQTTTTAADGTYRFTNLRPGQYTVHELLPTGYYAVDADLGNVNGAHDGTASDLQTTSNIVLTSGQNGVHYDFCVQQPVSISGTVRVPPSGDCTTDPTAPPLAGVTVQLLDSQGNLLQTTTTAADGTYHFTNLRAGQYTVHELLPTGYYAVDADLGKVNGTSDGAATDLQTTSNIVLTSAQNGVQYDFCLQQPVSISGTVRVPPSGDCTTDPTAPPLAGVTVQLLDGQGNLLQTTTTAADGTYHFTNLRPGQYTVHELPPTGYYAVDADLGNVNGTPDGTASDLQTTANIALTSAQNGVHYDFCLQQPVSISGTVRVPPSGDCTTDPTAPGLGGVSVELLDSQGNVLQTTTTAADGTYHFTNLRPGHYTVHELLPASYYAVDADLGNVDGTSDGAATDLQTTSNIVLTSGQSGVQYDFCVQQPVSISGTVRVPPSGDCTTDPTAPPLAGVTVQLLDGQGNLLQTTITAADGTYHFTNLRAGQYTVHELPPTGYYAVDADLGNVNGTSDGTASDLQTTANIVLTSGQNGVQYDFCLQQPVNISGTIRVPPTGDCTTDPTAPVLGGVGVQLLDSQGNVLQTTTTAADGTYGFTNLRAGRYTVHELPPAGYYAVDDHVGSQGGTAVDIQTIANITLNSGAAGVHYDFCIQQPVSISGIVKNAIYGDCLTTPSDPPVSGVTVQLLDSQGNVIGTTTTNAAGVYTFGNLKPGTYGVHELPPPGYFDADSQVGSAGGTITGQDLITSVGLTSGTQGVGYNFCVLPGGAVSGYVFQDGPAIQTKNVAQDLPGILATLPTIRDGVRRPGDAPIAGVTLELADASGALLLDQQGNPIQAVTDPNGFYQFTNLPPGLYTVVEVPPGGYVSGVNTAGSLGGLAINPTLISVGAQSLGVSASDALLQAVGTNDAIASIPLGAGQSSIDNNFSVVLVVQQPPPFLNPPLLSQPQLLAFLGAPPLETPPATAPPSAPPIAAPPIYASGNVSAVTWHLSVVDAGWPRGDRRFNESPLRLTRARSTNISWNNAGLRDSLWTLKGEGNDHNPPGRALFGMRGAVPVTGDFNGDGTSEIGVFKDGEWFLDLNGNGVWDDGDLWAKLGSAGDRPVTGDWDGDGKTDIGIYGPAWPRDPRAVATEPGLPHPENVPTGAHKNMPPERDNATLGWRTIKRTRDGVPREDLIDHVFHYGTPGDLPIAGDWSGAGVDTIGVFRDGQFILDVDGDGKPSDKDMTVNLGRRGDRPVVGDFDGDGVDELGVYRDGVWLVDINHDGALDERDLRQELGAAGDTPVVGDWNGDGTDQIGTHQETAAAAGEL